MQEDGVGNAIQAIYRDMEYAKTMIKRNDAQMDDAHEESEESWTFIGDESDPELARRIREWEPMARVGQHDKRGSPAFGGKISQEVDPTIVAPP